SYLSFPRACDPDLSIPIFEPYGFRHWLWEFRPSVPVRVGMSAVPTRCGVDREPPRYPRPRWLRTSLHQYLELRRSALPADRLQEASLACKHAHTNPKSAKTVQPSP